MSEIEEIVEVKQELLQLRRFITWLSWLEETGEYDTDDLWEGLRRASNIFNRCNEIIKEHEQWLNEESKP